MRKLVSVLLVSALLCSQTLLVSASDLSAKDLSMQYEKNIVFSVTGGYWEFPTDDVEFEPDEPMGIYESVEPSKELLDKYVMYTDLVDQIGILDSEVTYEDAEAYALTKDELLELSTVTFSYYLDYREGSLIQYYVINWANTTKTQGYVVWKDDIVVEYRRLS